MYSSRNEVFGIFNSPFELSSSVRCGFPLIVHLQPESSSFIQRGTIRRMLYRHSGFELSRSNYQVIFSENIFRLRAGTLGGVMKTSAKGNRKVRYAVVGLGHLAQVAVLPAFRSARNSELVAVISDDPPKRKKLAQKYGVEKVYSYEAYDECMAQGVDAVYLVLPNHLHRDYAIRAANAGVHVLCEKPMAVTEEDCEAMIEAAEASHVKLMIAYRLHFEKANLEAIRLR